MKHPRTRFAAYIPVGPSSLDIARVADLVDSLITFEPYVEAIVLIDHGAIKRDLSLIVDRVYLDRLLILRHSKQSDQGTWLGAGCVTNLASLKALTSIPGLDFVVKLDSDALVIRPFANKIAEIFRSDATLGIIGTFGNSSNRETRTMKYDAASLLGLQAALQVADKVRKREILDNIHIVHWNLFTDKQLKYFLTICNEFKRAEENGFYGGHCQGGSYAISRSFVTRMHREGYLNNARRWLSMPFSEDRMMGIYCSAVGLRLGDFSAESEPFGIQAGGLPFPPEELLAKGYSIIHSLRNNPAWPESTIRNFFQGRRLLAAPKL